MSGIDILFWRYAQARGTASLVHRFPSLLRLHCTEAARHHNVPYYNQKKCAYSILRTGLHDA